VSGDAPNRGPLPIAPGPARAAAAASGSARDARCARCVRPPAAPGRGARASFFRGRSRPPGDRGSLARSQPGGRPAGRREPPERRDARHRGRHEGASGAGAPGRGRRIPAGEARFRKDARPGNGPVTRASCGRPEAADPPAGQVCPRPGGARWILPGNPTREPDCRFRTPSPRVPSGRPLCPAPRCMRAGLPSCPTVAVPPGNREPSRTALRSKAPPAAGTDLGRHRPGSFCVCATPLSLIWCLEESSRDSRQGRSPPRKPSPQLPACQRARGRNSRPVSHPSCRALETQQAQGRQPPPAAGTPSGRKVAGQVSRPLYLAPKKIRGWKIKIFASILVL
jgi:hypothetical protein